MSIEKAKANYKKRVEDAALQFHFETGQRITEMDERMAQAYLREVYVDYGDLTEKAEGQIKDAFKAGLNFARPAHPNKPVTSPYLKEI